MDETSNQEPSKLKGKSQVEERGKKQLPVLAKLTDEFQDKVQFNNTAFVLLQHTLETTGYLFDSLITLGAKSENMFHLGKGYSESPAGIRHMTAEVFNEPCYEVEIEKKEKEKEKEKEYSSTSIKPVNHYIAHERKDNVMYYKLFSEVFNKAVDKLLDNVYQFLRDNDKKPKEQQIEKIIFLDDGGALNSRLLQILYFNEKTDPEILKLQEETKTGTFMNMEVDEKEDFQKFIKKQIEHKRAFQTLLKGKKYKIGIVEQTTAGTRAVIKEFVEKPLNNPDMVLPKLCVPMVMVSASAAKKELESSHIQHMAFKSIEGLFPALFKEKNLKIGLIGYGFIGRAIADGIEKLKRGHKVYLYDASTQVLSGNTAHRNIVIQQKLSDVFKNADYIFGATGNDIFKTKEGIVKEDELSSILDALSKSNTPKHIASVSSENKEFYSLIEACNKTNGILTKLQDVEVKVKEKIDGKETEKIVKDLKNIEITFEKENSDQKASVIIYRGGYPINFAPPHYSGTPEEFQGVLGLLLGGMIQAFEGAKEPSDQNPEIFLQRLAPIYQNLSVKEWLAAVPKCGERFSLDIINLFNDLFLIDLSSGYKYQSDSRTTVEYGTEALERYEAYINELLKIIDTQDGNKAKNFTDYQLGREFEADAVKVNESTNTLFEALKSDIEQHIQEENKKIAEENQTNTIEYYRQLDDPLKLMKALKRPVIVLSNHPKPNEKVIKEQLSTAVRYLNEEPLMVFYDYEATHYAKVTLCEQNSKKEILGRLVQYYLKKEKWEYEDLREEIPIWRYSKEKILLRKALKSNARKKEDQFKALQEELEEKRKENQEEKNRTKKGKYISANGFEFQDGDENVELSNFFANGQRFVYLKEESNIIQSSIVSWLLHDWAENKLWQEQFDFVFKINLVDLIRLTRTTDFQKKYPDNKFTLADIIIELYKLTDKLKAKLPDQDRQNLKNFIEQNDDRTLFIIEGCNIANVRESSFYTSLKEIFNTDKQYRVLMSSREAKLSSSLKEFINEHTGYKSITAKADEEVCNKVQIDDSGELRYFEPIKILKENYANNLAVDMLFGEKINIKDIYTRLAIVEESKIKEKENEMAKEDERRRKLIESDKSGVDDRGDINIQTAGDNEDNKKEFDDRRLSSYEDMHCQKKPIELSNIFEKVTDEVKKEIKTVSKLLVVGRAGIGKTTLCQHIVDQWKNNSLWEGKYDWVFWIPLRKLTDDYYHKTTLEELVQQGRISKAFLERNREAAELMLNAYKPSKTITLEEIIVRECFGRRPTTANNEFVRKLLNNSKEKKLFLLDGFDEIAHLYSSEEMATGSLSWVINQLINKEDRIVTTRPHAKHKIDSNDCFLEVMGYTDNDIENYVKSYFKAQKRTELSEKIISILRGNKNLWGMAHIPVNLSLLCTYWYANNETKEKGKTDWKDATITEIYTEIIDMLLSRYFKKYGLGKFNNIDCDIIKAKDIIFKLLEKMAFEATKADCLIIKAKKIELYVLEIEEKYSVKNLRKTLTEVGLIKDINVWHDLEKKDCYFLHKTFQEFFAARHIANNLLNNEEIEDFVLEHKYESKYEMVWPFISGLLKDSNVELNYFFNLLHQSQDLAGAFHALLLMRCLEETKLPNYLDCKEDALDLITFWIESAINGKEFAFQQFLDLSSILNQLILTREVVKQSQIIRILIEKLDDENSIVRRKIVETLITLTKEFSDNEDQYDMINALVREAFEKEDQYIQLIVIKALHYLIKVISQESLEVVIGALLKLMKDKNTPFKDDVIKIFGNLKDMLPPSCKQIVISVLIDEMKGYQDDMCLWSQEIAKVLGCFGRGFLEDNWEEVIYILINILQQKSWGAKKILCGFLEELLEEDRLVFIDRCRGILSNQELSVQRVFVKMLENLGEKIAEAERGIVIITLKQILEYDDQNLQSSTISALAELGEKLSESNQRIVIDILMEKLGDKEWLVLDSAVSNLRKMLKYLSDSFRQEVIQRLIRELKDNDKNFAHRAIIILGDFCEDILESDHYLVIKSFVERMDDNKTVNGLCKLVKLLSEANQSIIIKAFVEELCDRHIMSLSTPNSLLCLANAFPNSAKQILANALIRELTNRDSNGYCNPKVLYVLVNLEVNLPQNVQRVIILTLQKTLRYDLQNDDREYAVMTFNKLRKLLPREVRQTCRNILKSNVEYKNNFLRVLEATVLANWPRQLSLYQRHLVFSILIDVLENEKTVCFTTTTEIFEALEKLGSVLSKKSIQPLINILVKLIINKKAFIIEKYEMVVKLLGKFAKMIPEESQQIVLTKLMEKVFVLKGMILGSVTFATETIEMLVKAFSADNKRATLKILAKKIAASKDGTNEWNKLQALREFGNKFSSYEREGVISVIVDCLDEIESSEMSGGSILLMDWSQKFPQEICQPTVIDALVRAAKSKNEAEEKAIKRVLVNLGVGPHREIVIMTLIGKIKKVESIEAEQGRCLGNILQEIIEKTQDKETLKIIIEELFQVVNAAIYEKGSLFQGDNQWKNIANFSSIIDVLQTMSKKKENINFIIQELKKTKGFFDKQKELGEENNLELECVFFLIAKIVENLPLIELFKFYVNISYQNVLCIPWIVNKCLKDNIAIYFKDDGNKIYFFDTDKERQSFFEIPDKNQFLINFNKWISGILGFVPSSIIVDKNLPKTSTAIMLKDMRTPEDFSKESKIGFESDVPHKLELNDLVEKNQATENPLVSNKTKPEDFLAPQPGFGM